VGDPVISGDTKKKRLIGNFTQAGWSWTSACRHVKVLDHDFPAQTAGAAIPYGIYDVGRNTGFVVAGPEATPSPSAGQPTASSPDTSATPHQARVDATRTTVASTAFGLADVFHGDHKFRSVPPLFPLSSPPVSTRS